MLKRNQRLSGNRIEYIFRKGKKKANPYFTVIYLPTAKPFSRFCIVVSTKIEPKAVKRNLLRRRLYEAIRLHLNLLAFNSDIILIIKPTLIPLEYKEMVKVLTSFFQTFNLSK